MQNPGMYACYRPICYTVPHHMFAETFSIRNLVQPPERVGWPIEYLRNSMDNYKGMQKRDSFSATPPFEN